MGRTTKRVILPDKQIMKKKCVKNVQDYAYIFTTFTT